MYYLGKLRTNFYSQQKHPILFDRVQKGGSRELMQEIKIRAKTGGRRKGLRADRGTSAQYLRTRIIKEKKRGIVEIALHSRPSCNRQPILTSAPRACRSNIIIFITSPFRGQSAGPRHARRPLDSDRPAALVKKCSRTRLCAHRSSASARC